MLAWAQAIDGLAETGPAAWKGIASAAAAVNPRMNHAVADVVRAGGAAPVEAVRGGNGEEDGEGVGEEAEEKEGGEGAGGVASEEGGLETTAVDLGEGLAGAAAGQGGGGELEKGGGGEKVEGKEGEGEEESSSSGGPLSQGDLGGGDGLPEAIQAFVWDTKEMEKKRRRKLISQAWAETDWNVSLGFRVWGLGFREQAWAETDWNVGYAPGSQNT